MYPKLCVVTEYVTSRVDDLSLLMASFGRGMVTSGEAADDIRAAPVYPIDVTTKGE